MARPAGASAVAADSYGDDRDIGFVGVKLAEGFARDLADGVKTVGSLRCRAIDEVEAGDMVAAGQHHAFRPLAAGRLEDVVGANDVVFEQFRECSLPAEAREVDDSGYPSDGFLRCDRVTQVRLDDLDTWWSGDRSTVEQPQWNPLGREVGGQAGTDDSGSPGDEQFYNNPSSRENSIIATIQLPHL